MPDHFYVYPAYLTSSSSRTLGRRVPKAAAVPEASLEEIVRAAQALGFQAVAEPTKQYPRQFYTYAGRVKVTKKAAVTKTRFLQQLAAQLRRPAGTARSP
jgi:signal recognition particle subunit SRP19